MKRTFSSMAKSSLVVCLLALGTTSVQAGEERVPFGYSGDIGPEFWGSLVNEAGELAYPICGTGQQQSPIDLSLNIEEEGDEIKFDYRDQELNVLNTGTTLEVEVGNGSSIRIDGTRYQLLQFHFHTPSEHTLNGAPFAAEAHFVHMSSAGQIAVVGSLVEFGEANELFQLVLDNAPREEGEVETEIEINPSEALPEEIREDGEVEAEEYFSYDGSLTTPPCSEGLLWYVMDEEMTFSADQVTEFRSFFGGPNARPTQALNGRVVVQSDD